MSALLDALDELQTARRHIELIEMATRLDRSDDAQSINSVASTALNKIAASAAKLESFRAAVQP